MTTNWTLFLVPSFAVTFQTTNPHSSGAKITGVRNAALLTCGAQRCHQQLQSFGLASVHGTIMPYLTFCGSQNCLPLLDAPIPIHYHLEGRNKIFSELGVAVGFAVASTQELQHGKLVFLLFTVRCH